MIEIINLYKNFENNEVLKSVNMTIEDASILGLVGINGAGKSTLLRLMSGVLAPDQGAVKIDGEIVYDNPTAKRRLFFLSDDPYYNNSLTANAQAKMYSVFYNFDNKLYESYMSKFMLDGNKPIRNFSKGMKRQVFISLALACHPQYLFLDEAFDGLDPLARLEFKRGLIELQGEGCTIVISSHSLRELEDICDSFALIDGRTAKSYGKIDNEISNLSKLQLIFQDEAPDSVPFDTLHFEKVGRVLRIVVRGDKEETLAKVNQLNPIMVEEIYMDFEDMFIYEVQNRGYIKK